MGELWAREVFEDRGIFRGEIFYREKRQISWNNFEKMPDIKEEKEFSWKWGAALNLKTNRNFSVYAPSSTLAATSKNWLFGPLPLGTTSDAQELFSRNKDLL